MRSKSKIFDEKYQQTKERPLANTRNSIIIIILTQLNDDSHELNLNKYISWKNVLVLSLIEII